MDLVLTPEMQKFIDEHLRAGRYARAEDVIQAALESLMQLEQLTSLPPSDLEQAFPGVSSKIRRGLNEARAGQLSEGETFFDEMDRQANASGGSASPTTGRKTA